MLDRLLAIEACAWLATVEVTPLAPNGSRTKAAKPRLTSVSACFRCDGAMLRLPGTMTTTGTGAFASVGRNSLPSTVTRGIAAGALIDCQ